IFQLVDQTAVRERNGVQIVLRGGESLLLFLNCGLCSCFPLFFRVFRGVGSFLIGLHLFFVTVIFRFQRIVLFLKRFIVCFQRIIIFFQRVVFCFQGIIFLLP